MSELLKINTFVEALYRGKAAFEEAGRILVKLIEHDPSAKQKIMDENPGITEDILDTFERIGRKQLYYELTINETPGIRALRRCAYSEQVRFFTEPISLLITSGSQPETLLVSIHAMTPRQTRQAFTGKRIRSLGEQRAWLESQRQKPVALNLGHPYKIHKGKITFHTPCILTVAELARLLAEASQE